MDTDYLLCQEIVLHTWCNLTTEIYIRYVSQLNEKKNVTDRMSSLINGMYLKNQTLLMNDTSQRLKLVNLTL